MFTVVAEANQDGLSNDRKMGGTLSVARTLQAQLQHKKGVCFGSTCRLQNHTFSSHLSTQSDRSQLAPSPVTGSSMPAHNTNTATTNSQHKHMCRQEDTKFVYYLSAQFLMGRSLLNAV